MMPPFATFPEKDAVVAGTVLGVTMQPGHKTDKRMTMLRRAIGADCVKVSRRYVGIYGIVDFLDGRGLGVGLHSGGVPRREQRKSQFAPFSDVRKDCGDGVHGMGAWPTAA
jgi:hypothetical protein